MHPGIISSSENFACPYGAGEMINAAVPVCFPWEAERLNINIFLCYMAEKKLFPGTLYPTPVSNYSSTQAYTIHTVHSEAPKQETATFPVTRQKCPGMEIRRLRLLPRAVSCLICSASSNIYHVIGLRLLNHVERCRNTSDEIAGHNVPKTTVSNSHLQNGQLGKVWCCPP